MKEQDDIDHLFKSEFDDFAVTPPASVKESIDLSIAAAKSKLFKRWFYAGLGLVVILFVGGISMLATDEREKVLAKTNLIENESSTINQPNLDDKIEKQQSTKENENSSTQVDSLNVSKEISSKSEGKNIGNQISNGSVDQNKTGQGPEKSERMKTESGSKSKNSSPSKKNKKNGVTLATYKDGEKSSTLKTTQTKTKVDKSVEGQNLTSPSTGEKTIAQTDPEKEKSHNAAAGIESPTGTGEIQIAKQEEKTKPLSAEKQLEKTLPKDSLTPYVEDSLSPFAKLAEEKKKRESAFLFSLKPGMSLGFNNRKDATSQLMLKEKSSFYIQGEASYFFTPKFGLTSGLNYESRKDFLTKSNNTYDSVIVDYQTEYITDTVGGPITDSIVTPIYEQNSTSSTLQNSYRLYTIGLPVFFTYSQVLSSKLNLDLSAGAILSLQGSKIISENFTQSTVVNKFGAKVAIRAQLRYQFSSWGVSLNTNFGYDIIPVNSWDGIDRTRTCLDLGVGVHYLFGK